MTQALRTVAPIYLVAAVLIAFGELGWLKLPKPFDTLLSEVGIALLVVGSIHILDHLALIRQAAKEIERTSREAFDTALGESTEKMTSAVDKAVNKASNSIVQEVTRQTGNAFEDASQILQRQVESIKVMEDSNLISIYPSRLKAAAAIYSAMAASKEVWLMGISLNEFCREDQGPFRQAWEELVEAIRQGSKTARILLINPYCHGAVLRSFSETAESSGVSDRMETDVRDAAKLLRQIRIGLGKKSSSLAVRLYELAPTTFVCHLDSTTFVQSYHFWRKRIAGCPIPVFQYRKRSVGHPGTCIHTEMEQHFNFVWKRASIRLDDLSDADSPTAPDESDNASAPFLPSLTRGLEWGAHSAGMETVFIDSSRPSTRMREEIEQSKQIWIQGITLKAFFNGSKLAKTLQRMIEQADQTTDIRIMLLDPECDQAKVRAYREFLLNSDSKIPFDDFARDYYQQSKLISDLRETIASIRRMRTSSVSVVKKYSTAPHMFLLVGDNSAFVEQYSYGKLGGGSPESAGDQVILGSDMPLIEYKKRLDPVYVRVLEQVRNDDDADAQKLRPQPYPLLKDHFVYAWSQAKEI